MCLCYHADVWIVKDRQTPKKKIILLSPGPAPQLRDPGGDIGRLVHAASGCQSIRPGGKAACDVVHTFPARPRRGVAMRCKQKLFKETV